MRSKQELFMSAFTQGLLHTDSGVALGKVMVMSCDTKVPLRTVSGSSMPRKMELLFERLTTFAIT